MGLPECSANYTNSSLTADPGAHVEARCEANFTGKCVPLFSWRYQNGSTDGYMIDALTTPTQESDDVVYSTIVVYWSSKVICYIWEPLIGSNSPFQCSLPLENGKQKSSVTAVRLFSILRVMFSLISCEDFWSIPLNPPIDG